MLKVIIAAACGLLAISSSAHARHRHIPNFVRYDLVYTQHRHYTHHRAPKTVAKVVPSPKLISMVMTQAEIDAMERCEKPSVEEVVAEARQYLTRTAIPGGTMTRQGTEWTIAQLHPVFAVRLARSIWQNREHGGRASVFSAYRKPGLGVGGFRDKFNSFHSYGLAVDMAGIGSNGSRAHAEWDRIARANGLVDPYRAAIEYNHYQLIPKTMVASSSPMRRTITARGPVDRLRMWLASGTSLDRIEPTLVMARL